MAEFPTDLMLGAGDRFTDRIAGPWSVCQNQLTKVGLYEGLFLYEP
jgi:hypothetical protein